MRTTKLLGSVQCLAAAKAMLGEPHPPLNCPGDNNSYEFGRIVQHNVVIARLLLGQFSPSSAASVAKHSFGFARIGCLVGIAGGIPTPQNDIRLGDVVINKPSKRSDPVRSRESTARREI
jgi:nucleoside phosphorylase